MWTGPSGATPLVAARLRGDEAKFDRVIRLAAWVWAAGLVAGVLIVWASLSWYRKMWHWIPASWHASNVGLPAPAEPPRPVWNLVFPFVWIVVLGTSITFLVWQHRVTNIARYIGYPAHHSSRWGVGSWFVPVVNLWIPFQALRDCLPLGHPDRRHVLYVQMAFILSQYILFPAAIVASVSAAIVGTVLFVILIGVYLVLGVNAYRMVTAIALDHRSALRARG
jgi:hypothetical protein